ncbi:MAG: twin-arginine translocation signal domain-containing protein [Chitinophagaceae bacterium]|nr:twin-arginine translocation signal domain-containing protein [Rubrivivax sp.]
MKPLEPSLSRRQVLQAAAALGTAAAASGCSPNAASRCWCPSWC